MAKHRFVRMIRTQTGIHGTHHAGVVYQESDKVKSDFDAYIQRGFAEVITGKELEKIVAEAKAEEEAAAEAEQSGDGAGNDTLPAGDGAAK